MRVLMMMVPLAFTSCSFTKFAFTKCDMNQECRDAFGWGYVCAEDRCHHINRMHRKVDAAAMRAAFFDGGHFTPTPLYCIAWGDGCGPSYVDPDIYASITKTSILAFLEHNRGYEGAWEQIVEDPAVVEWELNLE